MNSRDILSDFEISDDETLSSEETPDERPPPDDTSSSDETPVTDETPLTDETPPSDETPSIYINRDLLPSVRSYLNDDIQPFGIETQYSIDGTVFKENICLEKFQRFGVYKNMEYSDDVEMAENDERHLELYTQAVPHGIVINSNVFLSLHQWNTLIFVSENTYVCGVCQVYCDGIEHIHSDNHKVNLVKHKPLYKYDLSIIRQINDSLHCGVCNALFPKSLTDDHFASKEHEDKMLFAINKVSDIMYDFSTKSDKVPDSYHYSAKAINNNNLDLSDQEDQSDLDHSDLIDYPQLGHKYVDDDIDDVDDDDFYDNVEPSPSLEHSYASMARKPKTDDTPKVLEIDLGNKKVTVKFNSWNMVIGLKPNRFYCMVCTTSGHIRQQTEHCRTLSHIERLARCRVVEEYEMYLVRQVDDKLYHCGHCNNLQLINEMEDHIESQHPHTNRHTHTDSPAKQPPATPLKNYTKNKTIANQSIAKNIFNDKENSKDGVNNSTIKNGNHFNIQIPRNQQFTGNGDFNMYHDLRMCNSNLNDHLVICAYGTKVKITKMGYNIVCARDNDFYCGLCEVSIAKEDIKRHVNDMQHLILLQRTPFIEAFNIHLFRQIRDALHCAVCNELIQLIPMIIYNHKYEPKHIKGMANEQAPTINEQPGYFSNAANTVNLESKAEVIEEKIVNTTTAKDVKVAQTIKTVPTRDEKVIITTKDEEIAAKAPETKSEVKIEDIESSLEFIEVKNGAKDLEDSSDNLDESLEEFDFEEHVLVKLGNTFIKISNTAYNSLVEVGDGTKYCFVCTIVVDRELKKHVDSRGHMENMEKCRFVDKYKEDLLRQIFLMYHCSICNVLVTRKQIAQHLSWPTHTLQTENTKISAKQRKSDIKSGIKQYTINTQKENIYLNESETKVKYCLNILIQKENVVNVVRKNKIVIFNDNVLKISFNAWHSLSEVPKGWKCKVCQCEFDGNETANHVASDWHNGNLDKFEKKYSPALIRKINDTTLNCVMCNTEVSNKKHIILEHIQGKRHKKSFDNILEESSVANSYADCDEDVLTL